MNDTLNPVTSSPRLKLTAAAAALGISYRGLCGWVKSGRIRVIRVSPRMIYVEIAEVERVLRGEPVAVEV